MNPLDPLELRQKTGKGTEKKEAVLAKKNETFNIVVGTSSSGYLKSCSVDKGGGGKKVHGP